MRPVQTITVLGAGALGRQIAYLAARASYRTILDDISGQIIERALDEISEMAEAEVRSGRLDSAEVEALLGHIEPEKALDHAAAEADFIIEAVPEDLETKIEVYTLIDRAAPPHCVFAGATSAWSVAEVASLTYRAPQVLGMRFAEPVLAARLLGLVKGPETSADAVAVAAQVGLRLGKEVVVVQESRVLVTDRSR